MKNNKLCADCEYYDRECVPNKNEAGQVYCEGFLRLNVPEDDICPICGIRPVEIDDCGYYGCKKCLTPKMDRFILKQSIIHDGTGQLEDIYGGPEKY